MLILYSSRSLQFEASTYYLALHIVLLSLMLNALQHEHKPSALAIVTHTKTLYQNGFGQVSQIKLKRHGEIWTKKGHHFHRSLIMFGHVFNSQSHFRAHFCQFVVHQLKLDDMDSTAFRVGKLWPIAGHFMNHKSKTMSHIFS